MELLIELDITLLQVEANQQVTKHLQTALITFRSYFLVHAVSLYLTKFKLNFN